MSEEPLHAVECGLPAAGLASTNPDAPRIKMRMIGVAPRETRRSSTTTREGRERAAVFRKAVVAQVDKDLARAGRKRVKDQDKKEDQLQKLARLQTEREEYDMATFKERTKSMGNVHTVGAASPASP